MNAPPTGSVSPLSQAGRLATRRQLRVVRNGVALSHLWQLPLLLVSLALFGYAGYLLINPKPGPGLDEKLQTARTLLDRERAEAAIELLNRTLGDETQAMDDPAYAKVHMMLAEALDLGQRQRGIDIPANHLRIVEQTRYALSRGALPDTQMYARLARSYRALGQIDESIDHYRKAMGLSTEPQLRLHREMIEVMRDSGRNAPASHELEQFLALQGLSQAERSWALSERADMLLDSGKLQQARTQLEEALRLATDKVDRGQVLFRLGVASWKLNDFDEAERLLRACRQDLGVRHPQDAEACLLLGRILLGREQFAEAENYFQVVLTSHPDSPSAVFALAGRAVARERQGAIAPALADYAQAIKRALPGGLSQPARAWLIEQLPLAEQRQIAAGNYEATLELLAEEQTLLPSPPAPFFGRLARTLERRAEETEHHTAVAEPNEKLKAREQARLLRRRSAQAYIAYSNGLVLVDDVGYGEAMWKGIDLFESAGDLPGAVAALEMFVDERPSDPLAPEAMLRLGRAYQAAGLYDKAVNTFQRNMFRYANSLAASKSAVPLAQAYIAAGPDNYARAEEVLLSVVDDNPLLTPESVEFREAIWELAQLHYRQDGFEPAIARLEEFIARYPSDARLGQVQFVMADSYRKSAAALDDRIASTGESEADAAAVINARRERLEKARTLFDRVIDNYRDVPPRDEVDQLYFKYAHFYRADCMFDLGDYTKAIELYDAAAFRYRNDPSALAAQVQIVNAYCNLGRYDDARTANERAKWLLDRMPDEAFADGSFTMPREYWQQWLQWSSRNGLW